MGASTRDRAGLVACICLLILALLLPTWRRLTPRSQGLRPVQIAAPAVPSRFETALREGWQWRGAAKQRVAGQLNDLVEWDPELVAHGHEERLRRSLMASASELPRAREAALRAVRLARG